MYLTSWGHASPDGQLTCWILNHQRTSTDPMLYGDYVDIHRNSYGE